MRDLKADLETCSKATQGPWQANTDGDIVSPLWEIVDFVPNSTDAEFIAAAREGWPHAIERAIWAERDYSRAEDIIEELRTENAKMREALENIKNQKCPDKYTREGRCLNSIKNCFECMGGYYLGELDKEVGV